MVSVVEMTFWWLLWWPEFHVDRLISLQTLSSATAPLKPLVDPPAMRQKGVWNVPTHQWGAPISKIKHNCCGETEQAGHVSRQQPAILSPRILGGFGLSVIWSLWPLSTVRHHFSSQAEVSAYLWFTSKENWSVVYVYLFICIFNKAYWTLQFYDINVSWMASCHSYSLTGSKLTFLGFRNSLVTAERRHLKVLEAFLLLTHTSTVL